MHEHGAPAAVASALIPLIDVKPDVLLPITIFLEINDLKVTFLYRAHEPLVPIVIHLVRIKVRVVQHLLYEILDKSGIKLLLLGEILHNSLACSEKTWRFPVHLGQKAELLTNNMLYNILYNMPYNI